MAIPFTMALAACDSNDTSATGGAGGSTATGGITSSGGSTGGGGTGGVAPTGSIPGKVARYEYDIDADALTATTKLRIDVTPPGGDCVALESRTPLTGDVTWNDMPATSGNVDQGVFNACGQGLSEGPLTISAPTVLAKKKYFGLDVGFARKTDMDGGDFWYMLSWVGGCDLFAPCDTDPGTLAEFHYDIHHQPGVPVLCPGKITEGDTVTSCAVEGTLAPTYSAVAWASDAKWVKTPFMTSAGVDWVFYEVPSGNLANSLDPVTMGEFFEWITGLLGPYPYGTELRFAGGPTAWLGFEHPANIVLLEDLDALSTDYASGVIHVTMHETTHQWAGDRATIATAEDFVWKEATAEYLPYVFEDEHMGSIVSDATRGYWHSISFFSQHYPRPMDMPAPAVQAFYGDVYGPGPMTLYLQLEALIGRDKVLEGIQAFLKEPGGKSVAELQAALEAASGKSLKAYFDAWVFGQGAPEWPTMKIDTAQNGGEVTVTVTQQNASGKIYPCVVEVDVSSAAETKTATLDFGLAPASAAVSTTITLADPVTGAELDPRHKVIVRDAAAPAKAPSPKTVWIF